MSSEPSFFENNYQKLFQKFESDVYSKMMGIKLLELGPGYARLEMPVREDMVNFHGITHGGAITSLADAAFAAASNSHGQMAVALNITINLLKATTAGVLLTATGQEENLNHRVAVYRITVEDDSGDVVALMEGLVYRKNEMIF